MSKELIRFIIHSYKDKDFAEPAQSSFEIPINPEQFHQNLNICADTGRGHGDQGTDTKFMSTAPEQVKLDFMLDSTGAISGNKLNKTPVREQVDMLLNVVYKMDGDIHQPNFLKVLWGSNSLAGYGSKLRAFTCKLSKLDINFILFDNTGEPVRAKISATFMSYVAPEARVREEGKSSPDLTRIRTIQEGDRLPFLTFNVYADQSYYQKVARANGLTSFRNLKTGDSLVFPPLEK